MHRYLLESFCTNRLSSYQLACHWPVKSGLKWDVIESSVVKKWDKWPPRDHWPATNRFIDQADCGEKGRKGKHTLARVGTANPLLCASLRGNRRFVLARVTPNCSHTAPYASEGCPICWSSHFLCVEKDTK